MFLQFVLAFSAYLHVLGTQFSQKFSSQCSVVRPRPVLVVRGSPLQPLPASSKKNRLSLDPRSVDQTTIRGLCPWIKTSFTQPLTRTTVDQHRPSFDPWSVGLTVDRSEALSGRLDLRTQSTDRRLIDGLSVSHSDSS
ncbi:hypothetical protein MTR67_018649 [Solanum verrucosum]|uniref:Secreted protein n=1 Tax=Solanum verrucosum TaxID=315347 RepID=A0AAF0QSQ0_SOLVR|nr:hypothetical protein MTR67_018649 [Solanum verrucosum]